MIKPKIWIVSEVFFPEEVATAYIMTEICKKLTDSYQVNVLCGPSQYEKGKKIYNEIFLPNIEIHRIPNVSLDKNKFIQRILLSIIISFLLAYKVLAKTKKGDKVLGVTNPVMLLPLLALISKIKKLKLYVLVHDVFPDNLIPAKILQKSNLSYQFLDSFFCRSYAKALKLIVIGRDMKILMEEKLVRFKKRPEIIIIENWSETEKIMPQIKSENQILANKKNLANKVIFQFAGNIGRLQGLDTIIHLAEKIENKSIQFVLIGDGAYKSYLVNQIESKKLANIEFWDSFSRSEQNEFLNACDVGIVILSENMTGLGVPSKTYNILAAGKPIFYIGDSKSEVALLIQQFNIGWHFENNNITAIIDKLNAINSEEIKMKALKTRKIAVKYYSKNIILDKIIDVLK